MGRAVNIVGVSVFVNMSTCAHSCRYCSTGRRPIDDVSVGELSTLVDRLLEWRLRAGRPDFQIEIGIGHSHNYSVETLVALWQLRDKIEPGHRSLRTIYLGGLHRKSNDDMRKWLTDRKERAGIDEVHASFAGDGMTHDGWNRRPGDFEVLMSTMAIASELDLRIRQRIFVARSTVPRLDDLTQRLDGIPGGRHRYYCLFYYRGLATHLEDERITEDVRHGLPSYVRDTGVVSEWRSEREWLAAPDEPEAPYDLYLKLHLTPATLAAIQNVSCEATIDDLTRRTLAAYDRIPSTADLRERHGDRHSAKVYSGRTDIEGRWLDRYLDAHPIRFDRQLTHLWKEFY